MQGMGVALQFKVRGPLPVLALALALGGTAPAYAASTEDAARAYVSAHADHFGVSAADVSDLGVLSSYADSGTGVTCSASSRLSCAATLPKS